MTINSTHHDSGSAISQEPRLIDLRFSLRRLMAKTALADIFWANDLHGAADNVPEKNVLLLLVNPALAKLHGFTPAWEQILNRPSPPAAAYPDVIAYGEHEGNYWLALNNVSGVLLSERISELDERGIPLNNALDTLHNIHQTLESIQAGAYGYIEPGVLQYTEQGSYKILNAPLVKVMQLLTSARKGTINQLALHSSYLSPSVSVGDVPVTEDDTFSTASMLYNMLSGKPPFGEQSTLTAVAHGDTPLPINKLKRQSWETVEQALTYQRSARPENPEKFLALLKQSNRKKIVFPLAVLTALGVTVFAGQHLVSRLGDYLPAGGILSNNQQGNGGEGLLSSQPDNVVVPSTQPQQSGQTNTQNQTTTTLAANNNQQTVQSEQRVEQATTSNNAGSTPTTNTVHNSSSTSGITAMETPTNKNQQANNQTQNNAATANSNLLNNDAPAIDQPIATAETVITPQSDSIDSNNSNALSASSTSAQPDGSSDNTASNASNSTALDNGTQSDSIANAASADTSNQTNPERQQNTNRLLQQAKTAFNAGQLEDSDSGTPGTISLLRELAEIDSDNPEASTLMGRVVEKKYQLAERRLGAKKFEEAETLVQDSDNLIREFMLTDKLQRQVRMESKVDILREEQAQVDDLLRDARTAINLGTLSQSDGSDHALSYLRRVLFKQPGNTEAGKMLTEIASIRQQAAYRALDNGELSKARTYMRESDRLIKKYRLRGLGTDQQAIEARYTAETNPGTDSTNSSTQIGNVEIIDLTPEQSNQQQQANTEVEAETERQLQLQQQAIAEIERQRQLQEQANAEAEAARQLQLQQQAQQAEVTRQQQLQQQALAEAEAARQRQLQQQAQAEADRQYQLQQQAAARQLQLQQQQAAAERQRQIQQQQEVARQRQIQQQQEAERQRQIQQQQEVARQRQIQQQQEAERQRQIQQQQEAARLRQLQQQQAAALQQQLQQQQLQTVNGYLIDEDGFVIGEPPIADGYVEDAVDDGNQVIAIPVQRLQPNEIGIQEIAPDGIPQAVPVWEDQTLQQIQPVGAAAVNQQPQSGLQEQFDNFQAQANAVNVPFPNEEVLVPELQEVPLSAIEEILPEQPQQ